MAVTRSNLTKAMSKDLYIYTMEAYNAEKIVHGEIFESADSTSEYEQYTSAMGPGTLSEVTEAQTLPQVTASEGFTVYIANRKIGQRLKISKEAVEDNQKIKDFLKVWAKGWGEAIAVTKAKKHAQLFLYGAYTAGHDVFLNSSPSNTPSYGKLVYDSKPLFTAEGNERTAKHGGTYYNFKLTHNFNSQNLQTLVQLMTQTNAFNEAGIEISIMPDVFYCRLYSDVWYAAKRLFESEGDINNAGGAAGTTNVWRGAFKVIGDRFFTDSDAFVILTAKKGLMSLNRVSPETDFYEDEDNDCFVAKVRARYGCGVTNFRYLVAANLPQS